MIKSPSRRCQLILLLIAPTDPATKIDAILKLIYFYICFYYVLHFRMVCRITVYGTSYIISQITQPCVLCMPSGNINAVRMRLLITFYKYISKFLFTASIHQPAFSCPPKITMLVKTIRTIGLRPFEWVWTVNIACVC